MIRKRRDQVKKELNPADVINLLNIRYRVCELHTSKQETEDKKDPICYCNRLRSEHRTSVSSNESNTVWSMKHNTREYGNPINGRLGNKAWFARLALDTPVETIERILLDAWKISNPKVIISIIGGTKYFRLNDRVETIFINSFINIARKSNSWLLTNGYNVGIVQLVGQAINKLRLTKLDQEITAIGICKWGSILDVEQVTKPKKKETYQEANSSSNNMNTTDVKTRLAGQRDLEMNHTHYLMLDDGTVRYYDLKDFRTHLAIQLSKLHEDNQMGIPVVTIVVEGGKDTIANMYYDLQNYIPVIIIDGSGRVADFLNRWLLNTAKLEYNDIGSNIVYGIDELMSIDDKDTPSNSNNNNTNHSTTINLDTKFKKLAEFFKNFEEHIKTDLKNILSQSDGISDEDFDILVKQVMYCLQPAVRSDITVFNLNSDGDLSETILQSICKSRQKLRGRRQYDRDETVHRRQEVPSTQYTPESIQIQLESCDEINKNENKAESTKLLELAMDWNCIDAAKECIIRNSLDNILNHEVMFIDALRKDLPTFVYEFLKLGFDPSTIFLKKSGSRKIKGQYAKFITTLYTYEAVNSDKTHLKYFIEIDDDKKKKMSSIDQLNLALSRLVGDFMHTLYFDSFEEEENYRRANGLNDKSIENKHRNNIESQNNPNDEEKKQLKYDYIIRDLFIWAILMNYIDMAKVLLVYMKYRICPALIATKILKKYHEKATYGELKDGYLRSAEYFEEYAIGCLDKCDDHDVDKSCQIILQQNQLYGYVTCLQVAAEAEDQLFISASCCVAAINNTWYDKLHPNQTRKRDILAMFCGLISLGLFAPFSVSYREVKKIPKKDDFSVPRLSKHGIHYCDPYRLQPSEPNVKPPFYRGYWKKLGRFHHSLLVKCYYHLINYLFFLLLFSYVLLFNFNPPTNRIPSIHWTEILTIILVSCMFIEEIHYFFRQDSLTWRGRFKNYFDDIFKILATFGLLLFYIGLIVRFRHASSEEDFTAARIIMAIDLEIWWLYSLSFVILIPFLGPHLVSIQKMLQDLVFFVCVIAVVMIGYGVASRSMVYYPIANNFTTETGGSIDPSFDGRSVFHQVLSPVYYMLYGEFSNELDTLDSNRNAGWSIATQVLLAVHMLFVNILLINLLIAMFSKRFNDVSKDVKKIWNSQQYLLTREYFTRGPCFPPISLAYDLWHLCRMLIFFIRRNCFHRSPDRQAKVFKIIPDKKFVKEWQEFEGASSYEYAENEVKANKSTSTKSTNESDSINKGKIEQIDNESDKNNVLDELKRMQDELKTLHVIIEKLPEIVKEQLE